MNSRFQFVSASQPDQDGLLAATKNAVPLSIVHAKSGAEASVFGRMTFAELIALTKVSFRDGALIHAFDVHGLMGCGGITFRWDSVAGRFGGQSDAIIFSSLSAAPSPSAFPGLRIRIPGVSSELKSNGTRYVPINGRAYIAAAKYGTLAEPTKNSGTGAAPISFNIGAPTFPANLFGVGSKLMLKGRGQKHFGNAAITVNFRLGATGTASDPYIWTTSTGNTDLWRVPVNAYIEIVSATAFITSSSNGESGSGAVLQFVEQTTNFNIASPLILSCDISSKNTSDTLDLISYSLEWMEAA